MKRYPFGKYLLNIPDDHKIIDIHKVAAFYDRAFGFILEEISKNSSGGVFLDIGGNIGDTAAIFATYASNPIVSVEGSPEFAAYFRSNLHYLGEQVRLIEKFVRTEALAKLKLSYRSLEGTGFLAATESGAIDDDGFVSTADLLNDVGPVSLIKSDTDGMDGFIISDMLDKVPDAPLFFECDTICTIQDAANPWPDVFEKLRDHSIVVFDNNGLPMLVAETNATNILRDLSGYVHLQRGVHPIKIHYLDVWAFPRAWSSTFEKVAGRLRGDMLKPYAF